MKPMTECLVCESRELKGFSDTERWCLECGARMRVQNGKWEVKLMPIDFRGQVRRLLHGNSEINH